MEILNQGFAWLNAGFGGGVYCGRWIKSREELLSLGYHTHGKPNLTTHLLSDSPTQSMIKLSGSGGKQVFDSVSQGAEFLPFHPHYSVACPFPRGPKSPRISRHKLTSEGCLGHLKTSLFDWLNEVELVTDSKAFLGFRMLFDLSGLWRA